MSRNVTFALIASALMVLSVAAPALASDGSLSVGVSQDDTGAVQVSVTHNGSAVENATVTVEAINNTTYDGTGTYTTDANGTVSLPEPNQTAEIEVTAEDGNATASTTATISPVNESGGNQTDDNETDTGNFGARVSNFVHDLQNDDNNTSAPFGVIVANFVLENNPAADKIPDHAGPPEWLVNGSKNWTRGPPEHAGPPGNETSGNGPGGNGPGNGPGGNGNGPGGNGPPDHAKSDDE